ncbi:MAG TPA: hypothetical protein VE544_01130 [Nitrososphaeraceae archaeon]|nr:hypothetical protein [Nitrososphaeraceae archaeon]
MEYKFYNNATVMVVKIDFSNLPIHLRNAITNEIGMKKRSGEGRSNGDTDKASIEKSTGNKIKDEEVVLEENNTHYAKQRLNDALIKNRIHNYVAVLHPKAGDRVVIVQRTNAEQLGTHHCRHCGMEFEDKTKLSIHLRIHYNVA